MSAHNEPLFIDPVLELERMNNDKALEGVRLPHSQALKEYQQFRQAVLAAGIPEDQRTAALERDVFRDPHEWVKEAEEAFDAEYGPHHPVNSDGVVVSSEWVIKDPDTGEVKTW